jgi:peptidoglycan/LPS O-acetylase OafA/YrhL
MIRWLSTQLFEDTTRSGKLAAMDGVRGVAVLTVFLSHSSGREQALAPWLHFQGIGHLGVYLFFVLSGFLLAHTLFRRRQSAGEFYVRRFFRIFPLYALVVTAVFCVQQSTGALDLRFLHVKDGGTGFLRHLTFLQGDSVFWTIAAEFQFYFVMPFLVAALVRWERPAAILCAFAAVGYGAWYLAIVWHWLPGLPALKLARIAHSGQFVDVFLCGVLAAWAHESRSVGDWFTLQRRWLEPSLVILAVVVAFGSLAAVSKAFLWWGHPAFGIRDFSLGYGVVFALLLLATLHGYRPFERVLMLGLLRLAGVIAFGWYLLHFPVFQLVDRLFADTPLDLGAVKFCASFALCIVVGIATYLLVEKPCIQLSKRLLQRRTPQAAHPSACSGGL